MSGPQLFAVWALLALGVVGIPGYFIGWAVGRACLRGALDPARLAPVDDPDVRVVVEADTLPVAGRFPVDPGLTWSEVEASGDATAAEVEATAAEAAAEIRRWTIAAELTDAERQDDEITMTVPRGLFSAALSEREIAEMILVAERRIPWA
jgi:hypothetical protein